MRGRAAKGGGQGHGRETIEGGDRWPRMLLSGTFHLSEPSDTQTGRNPLPALTGSMPLMPAPDLPAGATAWHSSNGPVTDYSAPIWLHAKTVSRTDALGMAKSLHAVASHHPLWAIAEHFAVYCEGGGFVFACDESDQVAPPVGAVRRQ